MMRFALRRSTTSSSSTIAFNPHVDRRAQTTWAKRPIKLIRRGSRPSAGLKRKATGRIAPGLEASPDHQTKHGSDVSRTQRRTMAESHEVILEILKFSLSRIVLGQRRAPRADASSKILEWVISRLSFLYLLWTIAVQLWVGVSVRIFIRVQSFIWKKIRASRGIRVQSFSRFCCGQIRTLRWTNNQMLML